MKKHLIRTMTVGLLLGAGFSGCTAKKVITRSVDSVGTERTETAIRQFEFQQMDVAEAMRKITGGKALEDFKFTISTYDTSRPVDSVTGKPPLASEMTGEKRSSAETRQTEEISRVDQSLTETVAEIDRSTDSTADVKIDESIKVKKSPRWGHAIIASLALLVLFASAAIIKARSWLK